MSEISYLGRDFSMPDYTPDDTAWLMHGPFASWLVKATTPSCIVELGTHSGYSYFAFCQSVLEAGLPTSCIAVDTWEGDEHAGIYSEDVYEAVTDINAKYAAFSTLLRKTFNDALADVEDGSIDILHVDGRHFYEDVKEDFESWIPKLSTKSIVLFHDTEVRERGFGVWKYWEEIAGSRPSFNFPYQHGLGVLFYGDDAANSLADAAMDVTREADRTAIIDFFRMCGLKLAADKAAKQTLIHQTNLHAAETIESNARIKTLRGEAADAMAALVELRKEADLWEARIALLQARLEQARRRPLKLVRDKFAFKFLRVLTRLSPPISERAASRFARSAEKRNPRRNDLEVKAAPLLGDSTQIGGWNNYGDLVKAWDILRASKVARIQELRANLADGPKISVVMPVYNPNPDHLAHAIKSVQRQSYANWELCIADDGSESDIRALLRGIAEDDARIKLILRDENGHISRATNSAIELATGDYISFMDHDDFLDEDALLEVVRVLTEKDGIRFVYTDEDIVSPDAEPILPHFKTDWNRDLLYSHNYVTHFVTVDASLVRDIGGLRVGFEGAQDYDFVLRVSEKLTDAEIHHIPKVLYHWRTGEESSAHGGDAKPYAHEAGRRALSEHLQRTSEREIDVRSGQDQFTYKVVWPLDEEPLVSIIMLTRDKLSLVRFAVESLIENTDFTRYEIIIVDNGSVKPETLQWFSDVQAFDPRVCVIRDDREFNYSSLNNLAVAQSNGEVIALLNNDVEIVEPHWLREMVSLAIREDTGCVGAKLYFPDDRIQHAGVIVGLGSVAGHGHLFYPKDHPGYFSRLRNRQNYTAVTGACMVMRRSVFEEVGGLNEKDLAIAFNDVDLCLRIAAAGYRNVWTPWAELVHHESASRGYEDTPQKVARFNAECKYMLRTWKTRNYRDPAYNPNLSLKAADFSFSEPIWDV